jgi:NAD-dependent SIR2 family protein deacetylase
MVGVYSSGSLAVAICDRCGLKYGYKELRAEADTQLMVCSSCCDRPDPYRSLVIKPDRLALEKPRPDVDLDDV